MGGSVCFLTTPLDWPYMIDERMPTKFVRLPEIRRSFSHKNTTLPFMLPGAVRLRMHPEWTESLTCPVCAICASDEEKSVSIARHLMRDSTTTDSYRIFALLSGLCQSPVSWYTSGPAQKYILRQIKALDSVCQTATRGEADLAADHAGGSLVIEPQLDVCLLMLYGHILFTSTSYTYALGKEVFTQLY